MKLLLRTILLGIMIIPFFAYASSPQKKQDTVVVIVDSLDCWRYHVSHMTLLVKDNPVHYTVVFDMVKQSLKPQYRQIGGSIFVYNAIRNYGEKYRKGILVFDEESEVNHD